MVIGDTVHFGHKSVKYLKDGPCAYTYYYIMPCPSSRITLWHIFFFLIQKNTLKWLTLMLYLFRTITTLQWYTAGDDGFTPLMGTYSIFIQKNITWSFSSIFPYFSLSQMAFSLDPYFLIWHLHSLLYQLTDADSREEWQWVRYIKREQIDS